MVFAPIQFFPVCYDLYGVANLGFFLKFSHLHFMEKYLTFEIAQHFLKFDYYANDKKELLSHLKNQLVNFLTSIQRKLNRAMFFLDNMFVKRLGKDRVYAILLMAFYINDTIQKKPVDLIKNLKNRDIKLYHFEDLKRIDIHDIQF